MNRMEINELRQRARMRDMNAYLELSNEYGWKLYSYLQKNIKDKNKLSETYDLVLRGFYDGLSENTRQGSIESLLYETADRFCRAQYPNPKIAKSANANPVKQKPADRVIFWPVFLLLIILNCGCLWVIAGLLMDMGILPVIDLGYSWFHMNVFPWFW